ncbi:MAG TPA: hypothetical protein VND98_05515 [Solirubrobacterales bacterium]|nr:hypothetical protein [Solirubrobacterales bacterium]
MPTPLSHMDELGQIEFADALSRLQGLIGTEIKATVNFYGQFFGCGLQGELNRVETLPPDHEAIALVLDEQTGFYFDPADTTAYVGPQTPGSGWLEFRTAYGISVVVERTTMDDGTLAVIG